MVEKLSGGLLVPVDFTVNTDLAVKRVLELAENRSCIIHLFHVVTSPLFTRHGAPSFPLQEGFNKNKKEHALNKLEALRRTIGELMPAACIYIHLVEANAVQRHIIRAAKDLGPRLIIIGKHIYHDWIAFLNTIEPGKVARQSDCPVLLVKTGSIPARVKSIVFPIRNFVAQRNLELLVMLSRKYMATIYLAIPTKESNNALPSVHKAFIDIYRTLKSVLNCPVEYHIIPSNNFTKASLLFAESIMADMILITPEAETKLSLAQGQELTEVINSD